MIMFPMTVKGCLKLIGIGIALVLVLLFACHVTVSANGRLFDVATAMPDQRVALVLGCKKLRDGWSSHTQDERRPDFLDHPKIDSQISLRFAVSLPIAARHPPLGRKAQRCSLPKT